MSATNAKDEFNLKVRGYLAGGEFTKVASEYRKDGMVKKIYRETAFWRAILPPASYSAADLDHFVEFEGPGIICEAEPDQDMPIAISFNDTADTIEFTGEKFVLAFFDIETPEWIKDERYLLTYKNDIRRVVQDNSLRDMCTIEDRRFMEGVNHNINAVPNQQNEFGFANNIQYSGRLDRGSWVNSLTAMHYARLAPATIIGNTKTVTTFLEWTRNEAGGDLSEKLLLNGLAAFSDQTISGIKIISTIKDDIIPDGVLYQFSEPDFMGKSGIFQEPTLYIEKKKNTLKWQIRETLGCVIYNRNSAVKISFAQMLGTSDPLKRFQSQQAPFVADDGTLIDADGNPVPAAA